MTTPSHPGFDTRIANVARAYNYLLGGREYFAADRELADRTLAEAPEVRQMALENRALLQRMVEHLAGRGIRRFLDVGAGLPCEGQVHEIAQTTDPDVWVVYVDHDPVVILHSQAMLMPHPRVHTINGDIRDPATILDAPEVRELLDPGEPVALLLFAILQFIPDDAGAYEAVARLVDALPPGSFLGISHPTAAPQFARVARIYRDATAVAVRDHAAVSRFFTGLTMVDPGLVPVNEWPAGGVDEHGWNLAGLAQKT
jgi:hypothetical protein